MVAVVTRQSGAKKRRALVTSTAGAIETARAALDLCDPPQEACLTEADMPLWWKIMRSKARIEWSEIDLDVAARICENTRDLESIQKQLRATKFKGPEASRLTQIASKIAAWIRADSRSIGLTARTRGENGSKFTGQRKAERLARAVIEQASGEDSLFA